MIERSDRPHLDNGRPVGRLLRFTDGRWQPLGDPLPSFAHAPPDPSLAVAPWVLPRHPAPAPGDVVVVGELAHRLLAPCPPGDPAHDQLVAQTSLFMDPAPARVWLDGVEVWFGHRLDPGRPWPEP